MNLEFYQDMQKRTPFVSLMGQFFAQLKTKNISLTSYGLAETDAQIMFIFFVLRYVMDQTLQETPCTLENISRFILDLNADLFHLPLGEQQAYELGSLIIYDIFCNKGEPIIFNPVPGHNEYRTYPSYITSEVLYDDSQKKIVSFKMDDDGFRLMLSTREMEENMEIKISSIIFKMKLAAQDYQGALAEIRHSFQLIKIRQLSIEEKILQVRANALSVGISDYKKQFQETYDLLTETRETFLERQRGIDMQLSEFRENVSSMEDLDPNKQENLQLLEKISDQLDQSLVVFAKVLTALLNFSNTYSDQNVMQMRASTKNRYSFDKMLFNKVLEDPRLLEEIDLYLHPLFLRQPERKMQLSHAFGFRKIMPNEDGQEQEWMDEGVDEQALLLEKQKAQQKYQELETSMELFIQALVTAPGRRLDVKAFYENLPEGFLPTLDEAREFFLYFSQLEEVSLEQLDRESQMMIFDDSTSFDFTYSLASQLKRYPLVTAYKTLFISKGEGKVEHLYKEGFMDLTFAMDNLVLQLRGGLNG